MKNLLARVAAHPAFILAIVLTVIFSFMGYILPVFEDDPLRGAVSGFIVSLSVWAIIFATAKK
jgi:hypothetical protein